MPTRGSVYSGRWRRTDRPHTPPDRQDAANRAASASRMAYNSSSLMSAAGSGIAFSSSEVGRGTAGCSGSRRGDQSPMNLRSRKYNCITVKMKAVLMPNNSIPSAASRAPSICQWGASVTPEVPARGHRIDRVEDRSFRRPECAKPHVCCRPDRRLCRVQGSQHQSHNRDSGDDDHEASAKRKRRPASRSRRRCSAETMNATPVAWIANVNAISERPHSQLSNPRLPP